MSGSGSTVPSDNPALFLGVLGVSLIAVLIVGILTVLLSPIGIIRFARTGSIGEAFNISEIVTTIRKIGWVPYISSLVVLVVAMIVVEIIIMVLGMIPVLGIIINLVVIAPVLIFQARYLCQVYDAAGA